jgi:cell division septation protein DedD
MTELQKNLMLRAVSELLLKHDCVIIPGLGGFVSSAKPAMISEANHCVLPPHKAISFNSRLQHNDGLFIHYISGKLSVSYSEAELKIKELNAELNRTLQEKNMVAFPNVGKLRLNAEGNMVFAPAADANLLLQSFGLKTVALPVLHPTPQPVNQTIVAELVEEATQPEMVAPENKKPLRRRNRAALYSLAMVVVALIAVAQVLVFNAKKEHLSLQQLSFGNITDVLNSNHEITAAPKSIVQPQLIQKETAAMPEAQPRINEHVTPVTSAELEKGYYIISGSYKDFDNADKNVKRFKKKGMNARIIPTETGYYRVAVFASAQASEVAPKVASFRQQYQPKAWVLHNI